MGGRKSLNRVVCIVFAVYDGDDFTIILSVLKH